MVLLRFITAYLALCQLMEQQQPFALAHQMVLLKQALQPHVDFYMEEEQKLVARYGKKDAAGTPILLEGGKLEFAKAEEAPEYERRHRALDGVQVQWTAFPMQPPAVIRPAQAEALVEIVTFTGGEEDGGIAEDANA